MLSKELLHKSPAIRKRVEYVCEFFFGGNLAGFASALNLQYRHIYFALRVKSRITPSMLAQIVDKLKVRAEWLLTGVGAMLAGDDAGTQMPFMPAAGVQSVFPLFDTRLLANTKPAVIPERKKAKRAFQNNAAGAARALYICRTTGKVACFFLGADASAAPRVRETVRQLLTQKYFTGVAMTAGSVAQELGSEFDWNTAARAAAAAGIGLGESLGRTDSAPDTVFSEAVNLKCPITVHAEIGELPEHLVPTYGTELGTALGAATYVDYLVFVAQLNMFGPQAGGLFIVCGEAERGVRLFLATLAGLRATSPSPPQDFAVIQLGGNAEETQEQVKRYGGQFYFVKGSYAAALKAFTRACAGVYEGKILNDNK